MTCYHLISSNQQLSHSAIITSISYLNLETSQVSAVTQTKPVNCFQIQWERIMSLLHKNARMPRSFINITASNELSMLQLIYHQTSQEAFTFFAICLFLKSFLLYFKINLLACKFSSTVWTVFRDIVYFAFIGTDNTYANTHKPLH